MTKVSLLTKPILKGKESLYLDIYPSVFNPVTGKKSRREFLNLHIYSNPETPEQKSHNKNTLLNANKILRTKKKLLEKGEYEFTSQKVSVSFKEVEKMNRSKDFLIDILQQVRNIEKQILEYLK